MGMENFIPHAQSIPVPVSCYTQDWLRDARVKQERIKEPYLKKLL